MCPLEIRAALKFDLPWASLSLGFFKKNSFLPGSNIAGARGALQSGYSVVDSVVTCLWASGVFWQCFRVIQITEVL